MATPVRSLRSSSRARQDGNKTPTLSSKKSSKASRLDTILSTYQCPVHDDPLALVSQATKNRCPFGHKTTGNKRGEAFLRRFSSHFCVKGLLGICSESVTIYPGGGTDDDLGLVKCDKGIHASTEDLLDDDFLMKNYASVIMGKPINNNSVITLKRPLVDDGATVEAPKCVLCSNAIVDTPFGLLENCDHSFCADCILKFYEEGNRSCPTCEAESNRVIISRYFTDSKPEKMRMYEYCRRSVDITEGIKNQSISLQGSGRDDTLVIEPANVEANPPEVDNPEADNPEADAINNEVNHNADPDQVIINAEVVEDGTEADGDSETEQIEPNENRRRSYCYIV